MKTNFLRSLVALAAGLLLAFSAAADTIETRDGRLIQGQYLGGTQTNVRFLVDGEVRLIPVADILAITFGTAGSGATRAPERPRESVPAPAAPEPRAAEPRPAETERDPRVPSTPTRVTVPAGTAILVRMIDSVDSGRNKIGDRFRASLEDDLVVDGYLVARRGTDVYGRLVEVREAGRLAGRSELALELTDILIHQQLQPIVTGEYEVAGAGRGADTARKVGIGAAAGAAIGAVAGGGKGAAIGAGVGAGAGTAIQVLTRGEQVRVPSETLLEFRLREAFTVRIGG